MSVREGEKERENLIGSEKFTVSKDERERTVDKERIFETRDFLQRKNQERADCSVATRY
jgi:hypothetical protein